MEMQLMLGSLAPMRELIWSRASTEGAGPWHAPPPSPSRPLAPSGTEDWISCAIVGCTPLHLAAVRGSVDVARALLTDYVSVPKAAKVLPGCAG